VAVKVTLAPVVGVVVDAVRSVVVDVVPDEVMVIDTELDVLAEYVLDPLYVAVIVYVPDVEKDVVRVAVPELRVALPSDVEPL
jgi:hypothetical protein